MQLGKAIVRRRELVTLLGGAAAWSSIANAQQSQTGLSLIGVLWPRKPPSPILLSNSKLSAKVFKKRAIPKVGISKLNPD